MMDEREMKLGDWNVLYVSLWGYGMGQCVKGKLISGSKRCRIIRSN